MSGFLDKIFEPLDSPSTLGAFGFMSFSGKGKTIANYRSALTLPAFYNGVDQISNDIAKLPKSVYIRTGDSRHRYPEHPLNYLISLRPNELMTAFDFWKLVIVLVILKGNCYVEIIRNRNTGLEESLIIRDNDEMNVVKLNDKLYYHYKGRTIFNNDILHFKAFTLDGITGVSVIKFAAHNLGINLDAQNYASDIYSDRGLGYGVIESDKEVSVGNKKLISEGFTSKMTEKNKFKLPVLDSGLKYKPISVTPAEAQFLETNKHAVTEIARWLNIAPHKLKDLTNANYSNIQQQSIEHVQDSLLPWIVRIEQELDSKCFTATDSEQYYVKLNEKVLLRGDLESKQRFYTAMVYTGTMTRNEIRALEDLNPLDGLDEPLNPVNMEMLSYVVDKNKKALEDD